MEIREMRFSDIPTVIEQEIKVFGHSLGNYLKDNQNDMHKFFVICDKDIFGYIGLWHVDNVAQILNFYILEEYQNKGYGTMLLNYAFSYLREKEIDTITLEVRESNQKALNLYEKKGFKKATIRRHYYENGEDAILLLKEVKKCLY